MTLVVPPSASGPAADEPTGPADDARTVQDLPGTLRATAPGDDAVSAAVGRLSGEFSGRVDRRLLIRVVRDCRRELGGSPVGALPELVERLARYRLDRHIG
ncbi:MAG: hypothetical protein DI571_11190 [Arsenicicoccus sp.]|nr:MAG: hypothetical protein DI571_11190 [Arsenicicoccus sp.]